MKITLEANEEARTVYDRGRKRHVCDMRLGNIEATAPNKVEAATALRAELMSRTVAPRPMVRVLKDGRVAVAYLSGATPDGVLGWSVDLNRADGSRGGGGMGADLHGATLDSDPCAIESALRRAFDHYVDSINEALG